MYFTQQQIKKILILVVIISFIITLITSFIPEDPNSIYYYTKYLSYIILIISSFILLWPILSKPAKKWGVKQKEKEERKRLLEEFQNPIEIKYESDW